MPSRATADERLTWHVAHSRACACRPMPPSLERLDAGRTRAELRQLLDGQDARSLAQSVRARALVDERPGRISEVAALAGHANWVVAMRAIDLLEKIARDDPAWVQPHRRVFLVASASDRWLIRLQVVRALPLLKWTPKERVEVIRALERDIRHPQLFVRAWALDSLATFATRTASLMPVVRRTLMAFDRSASAALRARARQIRARLEKNR
jgi:hypothetical protein